MLSPSLVFIHDKLGRDKVRKYPKLQEDLTPFATPVC